MQGPNQYLGMGYDALARVPRTEICLRLQLEPTSKVSLHRHGPLYRSTSYRNMQSIKFTRPAVITAKHDLDGSNLEMRRKREDMISGDAGASSSTASPSSTPSGLGSSRYEVFLSFNGNNTRKTFTDHLYNKLTEVGVQTFRDNEELRVGKGILDELMKAIEESTIFIPIFSRGYASSDWCLIELARMVERMNPPPLLPPTTTTNNNNKKKNGLVICPVFYNVTPGGVKRQTGSFAKAFVQHTKTETEGKIAPGTVQSWRDALKQAAELKGWERKKIANG